MVLTRELTKLYEETLRGTIDEVLALLIDKKPRGEYTIIIEGNNKDNSNNELSASDKRDDF
jgi:16S rRNA (cytidine1402-2'-O)-methyltransferase